MNPPAAEKTLQIGGTVIARRAGNSIAISLIGGDARLTGGEAQHDFAWLDQIAWIAKRAKLKSETYLIDSPLAAIDESEAGRWQR